MAITITDIKAREILDSRGNPTVEVDLHTTAGLFRAAVPSGASTGQYEACELRDGDKSRYLGKGVLKAIENIHSKIKPALIGKDVTKQQDIDETMIKLDGTKNKTSLGANAILGVSMAVARAGAGAAKQPLYRYLAQLNGTPEIRMPVPCFNVINGGSHAGNKLPLQEYMIAPTGARTFAEALRMGAEVYHTLKGIIKKKHGIDACNVGDEGGFAPPVETAEDPLTLLVEAIKQAGYEGRIKICMDCAASELWKEDQKQYDMNFKGTPPQMIEGKALSALYADWAQKYPIVSIEDPFDQDDWSSWTDLTAKLVAAGGKTQVVGDDLTVTNVERVKRAIELKSCNSLLLKVNQIGSVTEAMAASKMARDAGWTVMVSHRSGETEDTFIADLVVALATGQIKTGAPCRGERVGKLNQLLRIEEEAAGTAYGVPAWV
eukprot:TRINITY_DN20885_c0_g1_i1.p1 TRINITY_DN20885_c0_g1~~TRINITY_DN20885_c0_g1_i1.p1  ORF type:complete len:434 (+),score=146.98 TRINITY_DN20885_c0_g1_i1:98-1399(+)